MKLQMPAEFAPHRGTLLIWPQRPGSWGVDPTPARRAFQAIARALAPGERVYVLAGPEAIASAREMVGDCATVLPVASDDAWARDVCPTFVKDENGRLMGVDWAFNAWGGTYNGLYAHWDRDDAVAAAVCRLLDLPRVDAHPFVLEGGSIHSDGEGTVLVTESCLLSPGRNPELSRGEIEDRLRQYLGAEKILWLPRGIYNDETDEHVDNMCAFLRPGEVVLAWTEEEADPQYPLSQASLRYLQSQTDAKGRPLVIRKLPIPRHPITITREDLAGYAFEPGEDTREVGERLAASYVNFYFGNGVLLLPQFGGENEESDRLARNILEEACPDRRVVPIPARDILLGGGNIHCVTQQIPL